MSITSLPTLGVMVYPAKAHAKRVVETYERLFKKDVNFDIYVAAEKQRLYPYSDLTARFRQNRYFAYLSGATDQPDCHLIYSPELDKLTLYLPLVDEDDVMWSGLPISLGEAKDKYDVDDVKYVSDLKFGRETHAIQASSEYSAVVEDTRLKDAFDEARVIKDEYEIGLIRKANEITANCHLAVMSALPIETNERHIHAEFAYHAIRQGGKIEAYDPICCAGTNAGTLHYVKNDEDMAGRLLVLIDAGSEFECYASDVTRCFPINGSWTKECRAIYDLVWKMQHETMMRVKPGVQWEDLHLLAHRILIDGFLKLGLFKEGSSAIEIFESGVSAAFYPHGLGHMMGLDTHDSAGHANYEDPDPKLRYLRIRRTLEAGMVVTVEPGCYFNEHLLEGLGQNGKHFIDYDVLEKYMPVGGVRIEDDVLVTIDGFDNLTHLTSDADEVAAIVQKGIKKGRAGFHNLV